jgi:hypothetical protein
MSAVSVGEHQPEEGHEMPGQPSTFDIYGMMKLE